MILGSDCEDCGCRTSAYACDYDAFPVIEIIAHKTCVLRLGDVLCVVMHAVMCVVMCCASVVACDGPIISGTSVVSCCDSIFLTRFWMHNIVVSVVVLRLSGLTC